MQKASNSLVNGLPDYLDSLRFKDEDKAQRIARQILDNSYNYKKE